MFVLPKRRRCFFIIIIFTADDKKEKKQWAVMPCDGGAEMSGAARGQDVVARARMPREKNIKKQYEKDGYIYK